jgi:hypothetical protein
MEDNMSSVIKVRIDVEKFEKEWIGLMMSEAEFEEFQEIRNEVDAHFDGAPGTLFLLDDQPLLKVDESTWMIAGQTFDSPADFLLGHLN